MDTVFPASAQSALSTAKAPGHWVLARLGKRVLRPGGLEATKLLLDHLNINTRDRVVEFAPGTGITAQMILDRKPDSYAAIERDIHMAENLREQLQGKGVVLNTIAQETGLPSERVTKVVGEAMLSMHPVAMKRAIMAEAARLLAPGGAYGIHELVTTGNPSSRLRKNLARNMSHAIHHGVSPITTDEWCGLLQEQGLLVERIEYVPFRLLSFSRLLNDEGIAGVSKFILNVLRDKEARRRVLEMRKVFSEHKDQLKAIVIIARKPAI